MCLINEHAHLKKDYLSLQTKNTNLEGKVDGLRQTILDLERQRDDLKTLIPKPIIPVTDLVMISRADYLAKMMEAGIEPISAGAPLDTKLSLTSKSELDRIAPSLVYPADNYIEEIWDCEDYGIQAQSDAGKFHVSGIRLVLGDTPLGYHGFAVTMDKEFNIWLLESNAGFEYAGEWFKVGEHSYLPRKVFV